MQTNKAEPFVRMLIVVLGVLFLLSLGGLLYGNYLASQAVDETIPVWAWIANTAILSMPVGLLYGALGVLLAGYRQHAAGQISPRLARLVYWAPRVAGIVIILFVSLFALDVFTEGASAWEIVVGLFMHLLPSIFMATVLALAWRREWVGFWSFLLAALFFARFIFGGDAMDFGLLLLFSGPMLLIALLFGANWRWRGELHAALGW